MQNFIVMSKDCQHAAKVRAYDLFLCPIDLLSFRQYAYWIAWAETELVF